MSVMLFLAFLCFVVATVVPSVGRVSLVPLGLAFYVGATLLPRMLA